MEKSIKEAIEEANKSIAGVELANAETSGTINPGFDTPGSSTGETAVESDSKSKVSKDATDDDVEESVKKDAENDEAEDTEESSSGSSDGVLHENEVVKDATDEDAEDTEKSADKDSDEKVEKDAEDDEEEDTEKSSSGSSDGVLHENEVVKTAAEHEKEPDDSTSEVTKSTKEVDTDEEAGVDEESDKLAKSVEETYDITKSAVEAFAAMTELAKSMTAQMNSFTEMVNKSLEKSATKEEAEKDIDENQNGRDDIKGQSNSSDQVDDDGVAKSVESEDVEEISKSALEDAPIDAGEPDGDKPVGKGASFEEVTEEVAKSALTEVEEVFKSADEFLEDIYAMKRKSNADRQPERMRALTKLADDVYYSDTVNKSIMNRFEAIKEIKN